MNLNTAIKLYEETGKKAFKVTGDGTMNDGFTDEFIEHLIEQIPVWVSVEEAVNKWTVQDFWAEWRKTYVCDPDKITAEELYQLAYDYAIFIDKKCKLPKSPK